MNRLRDLPLGWQWATFDDVAAVESDLVQPSEFLSAPHIAPNHIEPKTGKLLPYTTVANDGVKSPKHRFRPGQILYSKIRPYLAKAVLVDFEGLCSADMYPVSTALAPRFLLRWLLSEEFTARVSLDQGRTVLPKVNQAALGKIEVPVPPLNEQRRIVAKLEALLARSSRAKEALDSTPAMLERFRQSVLAAAFRGDLTRDWREANPHVEPASKLLERTLAERRRRWEETELERMRARGKSPNDERWKAKYQEPSVPTGADLQSLPSTWCWTSIESVGHVLLGRRRAAEEYVEGRDGRVATPYLRVANVKEDRIDLSDVLLMPFNESELAVYKLELGDIVLSEGQSPELVGQSGTYRGGIPNLCIQATVHRFRPYLSGTTSEFAQLVFLHHLHEGVFRRAASLTTNIAHLTSERLKPLPFPLPPLQEQSLLVTRVRQALAGAERIAEKVVDAAEYIRRLEASSLAKAFRGELVPQDPQDEPASVLLERIRAERDHSADNEPAPSPKRRRAARGP